MPRREPAGPRQQEEMEVAHPLAVARDVGALRPHHPLDSADGGVQHRPQRRGLGHGELSQRLAVAAHLHHQLAGIGVGAGVVADQPKPVIMDGAAGGGDATGHLFADAARRSGHAR